MITRVIIKIPYKLTPYREKISKGDIKILWYVFISIPNNHLQMSDIPDVEFYQMEGHRFRDNGIPIARSGDIQYSATPMKFIGKKFEGYNSLNDPDNYVDMFHNAWAAQYAGKFPPYPAAALQPPRQKQQQ